MRIAAAQLNQTVGDFEGNARRIAAAALESASQGVSVLVTPELSLSGYPPEDLLLRPAFYEKADAALAQVLQATALLDLHLRPGARLLILSEDGGTPLAVARHLSERGFGPSPMTVFEHMAGNLERRRDSIAESWDDARVADLNTIALECIAAPGARIVPRVAGLADALYEHDVGLKIKAHTENASQG